MIPSDPSVSGPSQLQRHLATLRDDFQKFDTAKQNDASKADHIVSLDDLNAVANGGRSDRFSQADVEAAKFFLDHPDLRARLDTAAASDNQPGLHEVADERIGELDVKAALRDAQDFDDALTFHSQQPAVPSGTLTLAQQKAELLLQLDGVPATSVDTNQIFTQTLQEHSGDAAFLQDFFGALGADASGRAIYDAFTAGGASRTQARNAINTLQDAGLLSDKELAIAQFKPTALSDRSFSLKTLLGADDILQQVDIRRYAMKDAAEPLNTTAYDAYDALLTVEDPENKQFILQTAAKYGIDPALLAGTVAAEMDFDLSEFASLSDSLWRNTPLHLGQGPGIASVHHDTLTWAVGYLQAKEMKGADAAVQFLNRGQDKAANFNHSVEAAAIVLAALDDLHQGQGAPSHSSQDMAVIWGAYRTGIIDVTPDGKGYRLEEFVANRIDDPDATNLVPGDSDAAMGANAYQSQPYFEYLMENYG